MERKIIDESLPLKHTFDYVNEKRAKSPRRSWTDDQRLKWVYVTKDVQYAKKMGQRIIR
ncbi:MAG: hypothetical protein CM15mP3_09890 [Candidatus Poseidoniales archaeon]|nr:MAG: hypothetical protein CM15mP3_09890 [Candidatus Poseidoniales archaeon]